jgi:predicted glycosyltransferase
MKNILVYGVDGVGYGHIVKMANLVHELRSALPEAHILFISGYLQIHNFLTDYEKVDYIKLPSFSDIQIQNRHNYDIVQRVESMRRHILNAILENQQFDAIIVDFFPFGKRNELYEPLLLVKRLFPDTKILLTFRGIAFSKQKTFDFFQGKKGLQFVNLVYDRIVCLSDERIVEINKEYFDGMIEVPIGYYGYLVPKESKVNLIKKSNHLEIVINFGGGHECDGIAIDLMRELTKKKIECKITLVLGEYFKKDTIAHLKKDYANDSRVIVLYNISLAVSRQIYADVHIGKGGYNTTIEALFNGVPVIIIPRDKDKESELYGKKIGEFCNLRLLYPPQLHNIWQQIHASLESSQPCHLKFFGQNELNHIVNQMQQ